jgi:uncharacterized cofD-like protein
VTAGEGRPEQSPAPYYNQQSNSYAEQVSGSPSRLSRRSSPAVVAFGGGHGLAASLAALRRLTDRLTAVVTVGDDGGSSGRLRAELGALPMGDLRMALAALAAPDTAARSWSELFQHRFGGSGPLAGHAVGNLVLTALAELRGSAVAGLDLAGDLLGVAGRVLPLSPAGIDIVAEVRGADPDRPDLVREVRGQVAVATTPGRVESLRVHPAEPDACEQALAAVDAADWLVLGPGSLYTSVLPHLLVPEMVKHVLAARARRVFVLNLAPQPGETDGFTPQEHLRVLADHAPGLRLDVVIADPAALGTGESGADESRGFGAGGPRGGGPRGGGSGGSGGSGAESGAADRVALERAAADLGARLHLTAVAVPGQPRHDPTTLAAAFRAVFDEGQD